jgi:hypothetical protein
LDDLELADAIIFGARPTREACPDRSNLHGFDIKVLRDGRLEGQDRSRLYKHGVMVWGQTCSADQFAIVAAQHSNALGQPRSAGMQQ